VLLDHMMFGIHTQLKLLTLVIKLLRFYMTSGKIFKCILLLVITNLTLLILLTFLEIEIHLILQMPILKFGKNGLEMMALPKSKIGVIILNKFQEKT